MTTVRHAILTILTILNMFGNIYTTLDKPFILNELLTIEDFLLFLMVSLLVVSIECHAHS